MLARKSTCWGLKLTPPEDKLEAYGTYNGLGTVLSWRS